MIKQLSFKEEVLAQNENLLNQGVFELNLSAKISPRIAIRFRVLFDVKSFLQIGNYLVHADKLILQLLLITLDLNGYYFPTNLIFFKTSYC